MFSDVDQSCSTLNYWYWRSSNQKGKSCPNLLLFPDRAMEEFITKDLFFSFCTGEIVSG